MAYDKITDAWFTPDSKHIAFLAKKGEKLYVVLDATESEGYDRFPCQGSLVFDGPRQFRTVAVRSGRFLGVDVQIQIPPDGR